MMTNRTRSAEVARECGLTAFCGRLQDDVEIREAERSGEAVPGRLFGVVDGRELLDQALLHREYRVRFDVRAARHENVRGQRAMPGRYHDEMDMRRAVRVPSGRVQQRADRAVGRYRIVAGHDRAEPEGPGRICGEQAAPVGPGLHVRLLDVVEALVVGLPDVEF